jgi:hypothetical protein
MSIYILNIQILLEIDIFCVAHSTENFILKYYMLVGYITDYV